MFMTAYCRGEMFEEYELLESLESSFLSRIHEAEGQTLVTMLNAHAAWASHIID